MYTGYRTERRKFKRMRIGLGVVFRIVEPQSVRDFLGEEDFESQTLNISESGAAVIFDSYVPIGTRLFVKIVLFEADPMGSVKFFEPLQLVARVCSSFIQSDYQYRLGLSFYELDEKQKEILSDIVRSPLRCDKRFVVGSDARL